jgi:GNAT superfamily N-acetyltransferase
MTTIALAQSDDDIARCFPVMRQLRPHLVETEFVATVKKQQAGGYVLVFLEKDAAVVALAGFRLIDNLVGGRVLYVDDLVTADAQRSSGLGSTMFDWLAARAREERCTYLELDCGVQRFDAHRFYLKNRMAITAHHLAFRL